MLNARLTARAPVFVTLAALCTGVFATGCDSCGGTPGVVQSGGRVAFDSDSVDFGYVIVGQQKEVKFHVTNTGRGTLKIRSIDRGPGFPAEIRYTPPNMQLEPGETQDLTLLFQPTDVGVRQGTLELRNDSADDPVELPVRGTGIKTNLTITPASVDFGPVILDDVGEKTATLQNQGDSPVEVFVDELGGDHPEVFRVEIPGPDQHHFTMNAGDKLDLALSFQPAAVGDVSAHFSVRPCESCDPTLLQLTGKGVAAGIITDPEELDFGSVLPSTKSTKALTFKNIGNKRIGITNIVPAQAGTEFSVETPAHGWPNLDPGTSAPVNVTYAPTNMGPDSTRLVVSTDDPRSPTFEVTVLGYGGGPSLDVTPAGLEFGDVAIGYPVKRRVVIANKGPNDPNSTNDNLVISQVDLPAGDFAWNVAGGASLPLSIEPGNRAVLEVTYGPTDVGEDQATLELHTNDGDHQTFDVPVHGTGRLLPPCDYELVPAASPGLQFGVVQRGRSTRLSFSVRNVGVTKCSIGQIDVDPTSSPAFTLPDGPVYGTLLNPGERLITNVDFAPPGTTASGTNFTGAIDLAISSSQAPSQQIQLTGRGAEVCLSITPSGVDFGVVEPNCETNDRKFTIYNACHTTVKVTDIETGVGQSEFRVIKPANLDATHPIVLAPQTDVSFTARYRPVDIGEDHGTVEVYTDQTITGTPPQPYVLTLTGQGENDARATETFVQADQAKADILFVVDDSGSMDDKQVALATNFQAFMKFAQETQIDYHIAVTTTSATDGDSSCGPPDTANGRFYPLSGGNRIVTPQTQPDPVATFAQNVHVGSDGCSTEQGLEGAYEAVTDPNLNGTNSGFLRPDAYLSVIIVSDSDDQSTKPVNFYTNFFQNIKGARGANLVSISAIVNYDDSICQANGMSPEDDNPAQRYIQAVQTTGGILESVCTANWSASLQKLGLIAFGYKSRFILNSDPDPATLQVFIDGTEVPAGPLWSYSADSNSVDFLPTAVPPAGSNIQISYAVACH